MSTLLNDSLLNPKWFPPHRDPDTDSDQIVPNLYGLNINDNVVPNPQATTILDIVEESLKFNEQIQYDDPISPTLSEKDYSNTDVH